MKERFNMRELERELAALVFKLPPLGDGQIDENEKLELIKSYIAVLYKHQVNYHFDEDPSNIVWDKLVPNEEDRIGPLGIAAYNRIAEAVMNAQNADDWMKNNGKNITHVKDIIERLSDMTWTERSGDSLLNVKIIPLYTIDTTFKNRMEGRISHEEK